MSHVHLLAAWQHQDLEEIKKIVYKNIQTNFIYPDGTEHEYGYDKIISIFEKRFQMEQQWQFDVVYKTERGTDNIVVIRITREDENYNPLEKASLGVFTFKTVGDSRHLVRLYIEMGLTDI